MKSSNYGKNNRNLETSVMYFFLIFAAVSM